MSPTPPTAEELSAKFARPCPDCGIPIMWPWTVASGGTDRMPVTAEPVANGNVLLRLDPSNPRRLLADVIGARDRRRVTLGGWKVFVHHRMTCTRAETWARSSPRPVPAVSTSGDLGGLF